MDRSFLAGLVFFAIFVAGIVTGGFLMARWVRNNPARWQRNGQQPAVVVPLGPIVVRQMINQLDLNRDQRKAVNKVLLESGTVVRVLRSETDIALDRMQDDIDKILTPDQRAKLGKLKDDQRVRVMEQREKVHHFLQQLHNSEAAPAAPASGVTEQQPPSPATATQAQPAPVPATTPMQPVPAH